MEPFDSPFFQGATPGWYALAILLLPLGGFLFTAFTWRATSRRSTATSSRSPRSASRSSARSPSSSTR
jgi:hypothetical protein